MSPRGDNATEEVVIASTRSNSGHIASTTRHLGSARSDRVHDHGLAPLRYYAEYGRRYASRDLDRFMELFVADWTMVNHRLGAPAEPFGRKECRALTASVFAVAPDVRFAIDDVLACDERVIAMRASYHGQALGGRGEFAFLAGFVTAVEDGHSLHVDQYEYDDDAAMLARYAELTRVD